MSAAENPEKFTVSLLRYIGTYCACTHACISVSTNHDASGQRDAAEKITADRLQVFQHVDTDRIWWSCYAVLN